MSRRNYQANYWLKADFTSLKQHGYKVIKELGRGGYGIVYKVHQSNYVQAEHAHNKNHHWAIKINFNTISRDNICIEIAMLSLMRNKDRLALMKEIVVEKNIYYIVLEYFPCSSFIVLPSLLQSYFSDMGFTEIKHYLYELLLGLKQLKEIGVYHRDIKPANFLYNRQARRGIIVDFGLAELDWKFVEKVDTTFKQYGSDIDEIDGEEYNRYMALKKAKECYETIKDCLKSIGINKVGTESFVPLETIMEVKGQDYPSDMWPVGIILLQFISKRYTVFSNLKIPMDQATTKTKSTYYISFILELAIVFGEDRVRKQL